MPMMEGAQRGIVRLMTESGKLEVLVAGAGVAGLEYVLALRDLAGDFVEITVVDPRREFVYEPNAVVAASGGKTVERFDLASLLLDAGAQLVTATLERVEDARGKVITSRGALSYDVLVIAVGARRVADQPRALTFGGDESVTAFRHLIKRFRAGTLKNLVFAVPRGAMWHLPLYELALEAARAARIDQLDVGIDLVTPEDAPLSLFGADASEKISALLAEAGIVVHLRDHVVEIDAGSVRLLDRRVIPADAVVMVPRLVGPKLDGLHASEDGFVPVAPDCRVRGLERVFVIGDASSFPVKQGGIASQQADTAAGITAGLAGAAVTPRAFDPVLRGLLLTGTAARYLRSELSPGHGESSETSLDPLWWPPAKIAGRYLGPFLAERVGLEHSAPSDPDHLAVEIPLDSRITD